MLKRIAASLGHRAIAAGAHVPDVASFRAFDQQARTMRLIRKLDINLVLDVGANRGFWSQHLRQSGYTGAIMTFEPLAANAPAIAAKRNGDPNWHAMACALGKEDGTADFNMIVTGEDDETVLSSFLPLKGKGSRTQVETVEVKRLDGFLPMIREIVPDARIFLKMDTQGFDANVVAGAGALIDQVRLLQSEVSVVPLYEGMVHYTDSLSEYEKLGFRLADLFVVNRMPDGTVLEYDCLMMRG
ncbi:MULTISPECIES: FkbM family methyltransferase [Sphingomonadales]|nr:MULTISPECIES: FkbM family methyltransferase [Sphingomonas]AGH48495.1 methyltransferase FkbM family protein [Sphingomonas sp. MM-1]MDX3883327.1 FkbM family methyltransferase [Sphingomonas sp.]OHT20968.1 hypothetical protein BHE75_02973 [Sphingomonas haloaromaticamans]